MAAHAPGAGTREARFPGVLDSLSPIREFVNEAARLAGIGEQAAYRLRLAVDEIATNIIVHGYEEAALTGDIHVRIDVSDDAFTVALEDSAAAFDPTARSLPSAEALSAPLEERAVGGLGIMLALEGVDEFRYEREGMKNRNIFIVNREGRA